VRCVTYITELTCEKHNNPADFYLDKIIKSEDQVKNAESATTEEGRGLSVCLSVCNCLVGVCGLPVECVCMLVYII